MEKVYWITDSRFKWISLLLFLMFIILFVFLHYNADVLRTNPCNICAEKMGEAVSCKVGDVYISENVYHINGSIEEIRPRPPAKNYPELDNWTVEVGQ